MKSRLFLMILVAVALLVASPSAIASEKDDACEKSKTCDVERTCEKTDTGYRCTIKAKGETDIAELRECVRSCSSSKDCKPEGVTVTIEDIDGGVVVTCSSDDPEKVKEMHAMASGCSTVGHHSSCAKGEAHEATKDCDHEAVKDCDHEASEDCDHEAAKDCDHEAAKDCDHEAAKDCSSKKTEA